jgi:hypothetical protein
MATPIFQSLFAKGGRTQKALVKGAFCLATLGVAVAAWMHLETLVGIDPGSQFDRYWIVQLILVFLLIPIVAEIMLTRNLFKVLQTPRWMRLILLILVFYYAFNFYLFIYWSSDRLDSRVTWRMFSSGWVLLFAVASAYYAARLPDAKIPAGVR